MQVRTIVALTLTLRDYTNMTLIVIVGSKAFDTYYYYY